MLVLTRKLNESIRIGDDILITVVGVDRGKIRLGIAAPQDVKIMRSELPDDTCDRRDNGSPDEGR